MSDNLRKHRVEITFDEGPYVRLICPDDDSCEPGVCPECGEPIGSTEACYDCRNAPTDYCWIESWFDELGDELLAGSITLPVVGNEGDWDGPIFSIGEITVPRADQ